MSKSERRYRTTVRCPFDLLTEIAPRDFLTMVRGVRFLEELWLKELACLEGDPSSQAESDRVVVESILQDLGDALSNMTNEAGRLVEGGMHLHDIETAMSGGAYAAALVDEFERAWWRTVAGIGRAADRNTGGQDDAKG